MASNFPNGVIINERNAGTAIPIKRAVRVATVVAGTLATSFENGDIVDGVILATGDRILIKNQVSSFENGIYVVEATGPPFRDVDFEDGASVAGMLVPITGGTQAGALWNCTNLFGSDTVGVYPITFAAAAGTGTDGNVSGNGASTDNAIVRWNGITGTSIQNSGIIISDLNSITGIIDVGMSGDVRDGNGNELINFTSVASAVNEIAITNAATGTNPIVGVSGGDTNISIQYLTKGTGVHIFDNPSSAAEIRLLDNVGTDYFGIRPAATTTSYTITMPGSQGGANTFLQNDGTGVLSWMANASGDVNGPGSSTDNAIVRWDGTSGTVIKNSTVIVDDAGNVSGVNNISMSGDILAGDDNELINFTHVKSAVNSFAVTNALTGENPIIGTTGDDAEISLDYITAGEKSYHYFRAAKAEGEIRLLDTDHKEYVGLRAFKDIKNSYTLIFPNEQGQSGQVLVNDGLGQFSWGNMGGGNVNGPGASTNTAIVRWDGGSGTIIQNSGVLLTNTNNITGVVDLGMAGDILDQNNNELINFTSVIGAVNEISISNAITANNPIIAATGGDANISIEYLTKGTGVHIFDNPTTAAEIRLRDNAGTDYFGIRPAATTTSYTITMPATQGAASTFLQNNGSGLLSWVAGTSSALTYYNTSVAGTTSTPNTTYTLLGGMSLATPAAGIYMVWFSSSAEKSVNTGTYDFMISIDGGVTAADNSNRNYEPGVAARFQSVGTQAVVTVTGIENIQVYFRIGGTGSITCSNRSLVAIRLS